MLYAGKSLYISFKYSILFLYYNYSLGVIIPHNVGYHLKIINIVTKLKQLRQSAGNYIFNFIYYIRSSETLRNNLLNDFNPNNINLMRPFLPLWEGHDTSLRGISIHNNKHLKPLNDFQFGYYLAGLIDGNSYFIKDNNLLKFIIILNIKDISLAYYLKKYIGYGIIKKDNNNIYLIITSYKGLLRIINLINNKIKTSYKYNEILNNINYISKDINFVKDNSSKFNNYWLAGFIDSIGIFNIYYNDSLDVIIPNKDKIGYQLNNNNNINTIEYNIILFNKDKDILIKISKYLKDTNINIEYIKEDNIYKYIIIDNNINIYNNIYNIIKYLDIYQLQSNKYLKYLYIRKLYIYIQDKEYLNERGYNKIIRIINKIMNNRIKINRRGKKINNK